MASDKKRKAPPTGEVSSDWLTTYSDLVSLLLCFFVLLFSFSTIDEQKWRDMVSSFTNLEIIVIEPLDPGTPPIYIEGLPKSDDETSDTPPEDKEVSRFDQEASDFLEKLQDIMSAYDNFNALQMEKREVTINLSFADRILFASGSSVLKPESYPMLKKITELLMEYGEMFTLLEIIGHTDNVPLAARDKTNLELSLERAAETAKYIISAGFDPTKIKPSGRGEHDPVDTNDTDEGRSNNRRVEFILTRAIED